MNKPKPPKNLNTAGKIAKDSKHPPGRVQGAIRNLGSQPTSIAGRTRVFSDVDTSFIVTECDIMKSQVRRKQRRKGR